MDTDYECPPVDNQMLLDEKIATIIKRFNLDKFDDYHFFFELYAWEEQLKKEKQNCRDEYPDKKDYDKRVSLINGKLTEIKLELNKREKNNIRGKKNIYEQRKESFIRFENEYSDLSKLTVEKIHKALQKRDTKTWNIKFSSFNRDFWGIYTNERPELKR